MTELAKLYSKALIVLEKSGWIRGEFMNAEGQVCALGAVGRAFGLSKRELQNSASGFPHDEANLLNMAAGALMHNGHENVVEYNDAHAMDVTDIVLLFEVGMSLAMDGEDGGR